MLVSLALASSIPVLDLERFCPRKGCPWPWIFLCPWPWPQALCPRLHLWCLERGNAVLVLELAGETYLTQSSFGSLKKCP